MQRELPEETNRKRLLRWLPYVVIAAVIAFYMLRRQHVVVELEGDQVARYLPGLPHWDTASTFRTQNLVVENQYDIGAVATQSTINGPWIQSFSIPSTAYAYGEVNRIEIGGVVPAYPADLALLVLRDSATADTTTHSQRSIGIATEVSGSRSAGANDLQNVAFECDAQNGQINNCVEALHGDIVADTGSIYTNGNGNIYASNGFVAAIGGAVFAEGTGAYQLYFTNSGATDNIYSLDASTRFNLHNAAAATLELLNDGGGTFTLQVDGPIDANTNFIHNVTDPSAAQDAATKHYVDTHTGSTTNRNPFAGIGTDGTCAFDGVATPVCGATLSGSTYTLARTVEAATMTVSNGVTILVAGYPINCTGTITGTGTATISGRGNDGSGITGGARSTVGSTFYPFSSNAGGNGGTTGGSALGGAGQTQGAAINEWPVCSTNHNASATSSGCGGGGGDGVGNGGAGGGSSPTGAARGGSTIQTLVNGRDVSTNNLFSAGAGGGGGGSSGGTCVAGGGGGGGAWVIVNAGAFAGSLTVTAAGGNGAAATAGTGNCGGGGGGAGGVVAVTYETASGLTTTAAKGTGGAPTNAGNTGGNGFDGTVFRLNLSGDGT